MVWHPSISKGSLVYGVCRVFGFRVYVSVWEFRSLGFCGLRPRTGTKDVQQGARDSEVLVRVVVTTAIHDISSMACGPCALWYSTINNQSQFALLIPLWYAHKPATPEAWPRILRVLAV